MTVVLSPSYPLRNVKNTSLCILFFLLPVFANGESINFLYMAQAGYQPPDILERADEYYQKTGIRINVFFPEYEERYEKIVSSASTDEPLYDIALIDLIWVKDFVHKKYIDPLPSPMEVKVKKGIVPEIYSSFTYSNRLWSVPFHADFQLLYVNKYILKKAGYTAPPKTLEELVTMSEIIKKQGLLLFPIFDSWNKLEALVCEFTWLTGAFGGVLNGDKGRIVVDSPQALKALAYMIFLLKNGLVNPYSLQSDEMFSSEVFLSEDCAFTTNWTFLLEQARKTGLPVKDHWEAALIPVSGEIKGELRHSTASISGFEGLGVLSNSDKKEASWSFIEFLSSPEFQQRHLDYMSVWEDVWSTDVTAKSDPYIKLKEDQIKGVFNRPSAVNYKEISGIIQKWLYEALKGDTAPKEALHHAQKEIDEAVQVR